MSTSSKQRRTPAKQTPGSGQRTRKRQIDRELSERKLFSLAAKRRNPLSNFQEDISVVSVAASSVLPLTFTPRRTPNKNRGASSLIRPSNSARLSSSSLVGMSFSPVTFASSPSYSHLHAGSRTPMSTPSRTRSDLGSMQKLRLVNEHEELVSELTRWTGILWGRFFLRKVRSMSLLPTIKWLSGAPMCTSTNANVDLSRLWRSSISRWNTLISKVSILWNHSICRS